MGKTTTDSQLSIEAGKAITITADSRKDATKKLNDMRKHAEDAGLVYKAGGFIKHREGNFSAVITFDKQ